MLGVQPAAEVTIYNGGLSAVAVAVFDSGSTYTVFNPQHALLLDIEDVTTGDRVRVNTLAGPCDIYLFDLEIQLQEAGGRFGAQVGFFESRSARNILGRSVIFDAFEIGFHERAQTLHLRREL